MDSIHQIKTLEVTETPLLLFECTLRNGNIVRWSTHRATVDGNEYEARVQRHSFFDFRSGSEQAVDAASRLSVTLANADSQMSQIQRSEGWKGAKLLVQLVFYNLLSRTAVCAPESLFRGICEAPSEITEASIRLTFTSRTNLERTLLPDVRIQRHCPWVFPRTEAERLEARDGANRGRYSPFFRCGYSADQSGGCGNLDDTGKPYETCNYTKEDCTRRGMFEADAQGQATRRFGGLGFVPTNITVRTSGDKSSRISSTIENEGRYNDFVPLVYGTAWYRPPVVFARNDGNLTHMEVLLAGGEISDVLKVVVNGIEMPRGDNAPQATSTGWFNIFSYGRREGAFNLDFRDASGAPTGDAYGSMAALSVVVPNRIVEGSRLPKVDVLIQGLKVPTFDVSGDAWEVTFSNNPAWIVLDILRRSGWREEELDLPAFAVAAERCDEEISITASDGSTRKIKRYACNLVLQARRSAADVIKGVRGVAALYLTYGSRGRLQLHCEGSFKQQNENKSESGNSVEQLNGGWPAYEFGDGTSIYSDILRKPTGEPSLKVWCRPTPETPNRLSVEFQDELNEYQQDSLSLVELDDATLLGYEISAPLAAYGLPNFHQAARIARLTLDKSVRGNYYVEFESGVRAVGLRIGDLITLTYAREGLQRQPFRVIRLQPSQNSETTLITAQWHDDLWYSRPIERQLTSQASQEALLGLPRPLTGPTVHQDGTSSFVVQELYRKNTDDTWSVELSADYVRPPRMSKASPRPPKLSLFARLEGGEGTLTAGQTYYYGCTAVDDSLSESALSFLVRVVLPATSVKFSVILQELSFDRGTTRFNVYRGASPTMMMCIAKGESIAETFKDDGLETLPAVPPDASFDHANFYFRQELAPEQTCSAYGPSTIGSEAAGFLPDEFVSKSVVITAGKGKGQERRITEHSTSLLTVDAPWNPPPDATSRFTITEPAWTFATASDASPAKFEVANRRGATVQITGRAANAQDRESMAELPNLTRHTVGGAAVDLDVPGSPLYMLSSTGQGRLELSGIGFESLENTNTISAATLTLHLWNEVEPGSSSLLIAGVLPGADLLELSAAGLSKGSILQIDRELITILDVGSSSSQYLVRRGSFGTLAAQHSAGETVYGLVRQVAVIPIPARFFGSPASGSFAQTIVLPNVRVVLSELFVTNSKGNSQVTVNTYLNTVDYGIRTLFGGQFTLQVSGIVAAQSNAVPYLTVDQPRSVRDVFAIVAEPAEASLFVTVTLNRSEYCQLVLLPHETISSVAKGPNLPVLQPGDLIGLDVQYSNDTGSGKPARDLTISIRL